MGRNLSKVMIIGVLALLLALPMVACGESEEEIEGKQVFKIGWLGSLTGAAVVNMESHLAANEVYLKYAMEEIIPEIELEFVIYDIRYDPEREVLGYYKLRDDGVLAIVCCTGPAGEKARALVDRDHVPWITISTSDIQMEPPGYIFGVCDLAYWNGTNYNQYIHDNWDYEAMGRNPKVAGIGWNMSYGAGFIEGAEDKASEMDIEWVGSEIVSIGAMDLSVETQRVIDADADFIIAPLLPGPCASMMKELYLKAPGEIQVLIINNDPPPYFKTVGDDPIEGAVFLSVGCDFSVDVPGVRLAAQLLEKYYPENYERFMVAGFFTGWPSSVALVEALRIIIDEKGAEGINGVNLYEALQRVDVDSGGIHPDNIRFGPTKRTTMHGCNSWVVESGQVINTGWYISPFPRAE